LQDEGEWMSFLPELIPSLCSVKMTLQKMFVSKQLAAVWQKYIEHASLAQGILT